jgi:transcriptional regulator with XRE-family HTH domain
MIATAYQAERSRLLLAFGRKLRAEREHRNLSQEALAYIAILHRNEIGYLERGEQEPYISTLLVLADTL